MNEHEISEALEARFAVAAPDAAAGEFMWMPGGRHTVCVHKAGKPVTVEVLVDASGASAMQQQLEALRAKSPHRPYFDFNHDDAEASFWPEAFSWQEQPVPGIYAKGEWSTSGKAAIEGKEYRSFSGVFHVDNEKAKPARLKCNPNARLNMGGLVNDPAFKANLPMWAKHAGATSETLTTEGETIMSKEAIAALQAKMNELEQELTALKAKAKADGTENDELTKARIEQKQSELRAQQAETKNAELELQAKQARSKRAKDAVAAAVAAGKIGPKDESLQAKFTTLIEQDEANIVILEAMQPNPALTAGRTTNGNPGGLQAKEGPARIAKAMCELSAKQGKLRGFDPVTMQQRGEIAREVAALYAKEIRGQEAFLDMPLMAAEGEDTLGTLAGTLVAQRTLELFKYSYPFIGRVYQDFSDMPAAYGQTINTRIVNVPSVQTYSNTLGSDGRPAGWTTASAASTTDVNVSLDEHVGIPIPLSAQALAKTVRNLFGETAPAATYALAKYFAAKLYGKMLKAGFNAYAAVGAKVPTAYPTYVKALNDFGRSSFVDINAAFNVNEVPLHDRTVLLNSEYFAQAGKDPSLVTFFAGVQKPDIITKGALPEMSQFVPFEAPDFPTTADRVGFAFQKSALIALTRLPNDYTKALPGASNGVVSTVTDPDTGISVMLVQYVNHSAGYAEWRIEVMLGAGIGDKRAGLVITSK
jgi:phage I-like protein